MQVGSAMFARFLALFAALSVSAALGDPQSAVAVYLKPGAADAATLEYMKRELAKLMQPAGFVLEWPGADGIPQAGDAQLVVLELDGACEAPSEAGAVPAGSQSDRLASTAVSDGKILPFTSLHCGSLNRALGDWLAASAPARRQWLYGRALARLAAHELYHVLSDSSEHSREGLAKARFTVRDLVSESFEFERGAIERMRRANVAGATSPAPPPAVAAVAAPESGGQR